MLKSLLNKLKSLFIEEIDEDDVMEGITMSSTFEYNGPTKQHTVKTIQTEIRRDYGVFGYDKLSRIFMDTKVIYNPYGPYLIVITDSFDGVSKAERSKSVFRHLVNPPNRLHICALSKREYEASKKGSFIA